MPLPACFPCKNDTPDFLLREDIRGCPPFFVSAGPLLPPAKPVSR
ncbi:hypothetical protein DESPIG_01598 [Desulfovibrio piger ATCC 29098]|uniref:Uncharacterized protein n=1 Tax=Desulfovibrio piger ATCC 29098 TaxID=411464 RepID=B6WU40_9BACT|nr:hypothetical protein DESPIG_01598 [Desulfovibrio piger ATCC 29098]